MEVDDWLPQLSDDGQEDPHEVEVEDRWPGEPPEKKLTYRAIWAQSQRARGGLPRARQQFPDLPKWFFRDGRLKEPRPRWSDKDGVWEFWLKDGANDRMLTGADLTRYAQAYREITKVPLALPSGCGCR